MLTRISYDISTATFVGLLGADKGESAAAKGVYYFFKFAGKSVPYIGFAKKGALKRLMIYIM